MQTLTNPDKAITKHSNDLMEKVEGYMVPGKWAWKTPVCSSEFSLSGAQRTDARLIITGINNLIIQNKAINKSNSWKKACLEEYVNAWMVFGESFENALSAAKLINNRFDEPLKGFNRLFKTEVKPFAHRPETVEKRLDLSPEQVEIAGMTKVRKEKKQRKRKADKNNELAVQFGQEVIALHNQGYGYKTIYRMLSPNLKEHYKSFESVKYFIRSRGLKKGQPVEEITEDMLTRYSHHNKNLSAKGVGKQFPKSTTADQNTQRKLHRYYEQYTDMLRKASEQDPFEIEKEVKSILDSGTQDLLIKGCAGTGKSYLINKTLVKENGKDKTLFLAPTGIAATNYSGGMTIHAAFGLESRIYGPDEDIDIPEHLKDMIRVVVDEVYMCRPDIIHLLLKTVLELRRNGKRIQMVFLGDPSQLPSVINGKEDKKAIRAFGGTHVFDATEWKKLNLKVINLFNIRRVKEDSAQNRKFMNNCNKLRFGLVEVIEYLNSNEISHKEDDSGVYLCAKNEDVDRINRKYIFSFSNIKRYDAETTGKWDNSLLIKKHLLLAPGMKVMTIKNSVDYKNGSIGIITKVNRKSIWVRFRTADNKQKEVKIGYAVFQTKQKTTIKQLPVLVAKAISIHKSQGATFDVVNIVGNCFAPGMLYTALTRVTSVEGLHIIGTIQESDVIVDIRSVEEIVAQ